MKKLFLSMVAVIVAATSFAQSSMLATLSHNRSIRTFYGTSAFKDAYNAAAHGDVITLSSGSFEAVDIAKGLTIRGAGMVIDSLSNSEPTIIIGDFHIKIPNTTTKRLTLEGIYHNHTITVSTDFKNGTFLKCRFNSIECSNEGTITNLTMIHCRIANKIAIGSNSFVSCINSIVHDFEQNGTYGTAIFEFTNCVLMNPYSWDNPINCSFRNCILHVSNNEEANNVHNPHSYLCSNCSS